jgi:hypothetical protein
VHTSPIHVVFSGLAGAALGFAAAALIYGGTRAPEVGLVPLRPSSEASDGWPPPAELGGPSAERGGGEGEGAEADEAPRGEASATDARAEAEKRARAIELGTLRARERAAQQELSEARQRIAQLEKEAAAGQPRPEPRTRHEYDLSVEDWKALAKENTVKYRVPCGDAARLPNDGTLEQLGLAPDDYEAVRGAFEHSITRQQEALAPLCAAALGGRMDVASALNIDSCRTIIFSTASSRSESGAQSARAVASYMAGEAPRPGENAPLTARAWLALVEESKHFEDELAETFGPEEARRVTFSDAACFSSSSHSYGAPPPSPESTR